ncbi:hypothetical protein FOA52_016167 [Chlamydomonas sp. UWO 241]|nr:hypothetical protein FOA52_016167 [Chlamydomonas sp. UWO 241]
MYHRAKHPSTQPLKSTITQVERYSSEAAACRSAEHSAAAAAASAKEAAAGMSAELEGARHRAGQLQARLAAREAEVERLGKELAVHACAETRAVVGRLGSEDAAKRLSSDMSRLRSQLSAAESCRAAAVRQADRHAAAAEAMGGQLAVALAGAADAQEAANAAHADAESCRARALASDAEARARERDCAKLEKQFESARASEADARAQLAASADSARAAEHAASAARVRAVHTDAQSRVRAREAERLSQLLVEARAEAYNTASALLQAEDAARAAAADTVRAHQRCAQLEARGRVAEGEADRLAKAVEAAERGGAATGDKARDAEEALREVGEDAETLRKRVVQLQGELRNREKEVERAQAAAQREAKSANERVRSAEAALAAAADDAVAARKAAAEAGAALADARADAQRTAQLLESTQSSEAELSSKWVAVAEAAREADKGAARMKQRVRELERQLKARDEEASRLSASLVSAEQAAASAALAVGADAGAATSLLSPQLESARAALTQSQANARDARAQQRRMRDELDAARGGQRVAAADADKARSALMRCQAELAEARARASGAETSVRVKERVLESHFKQSATEGNAVAGSASKAQSRLQGDLAKTEAALGQARARISLLESFLVTKDKEVEGLQRLLDGARTGAPPASPSAGLSSSAGADSESVRRLESELAACRARLVHVEHTARSRELAVDKLRSMLSDKVAKEERRLARDKTTYASLRQAWLASRDGGRSSAGAVAAACREMRPVELVGLYEAQRAGLESELSHLRSESRTLAGQLRDAQNLIAAKERQGAWRGAEEGAQAQGRLLLAERRNAELAHELAAARASAAGNIRGAEARVRAAEDKLHTSREEVAALRTELASRPTAEQHRGVQREMALLERRLQEVRHGTPGEPGASADSSATVGGGGGGGGGAPCSARSGQGSTPPGSTRQMMARDKEVHRLGLRRVEDMGRGVLVALVQDVCIELDVCEPTSLPPSARKLMRVVVATPRMEAWMGEVCGAVYTADGDRPTLAGALTGLPGGSGLSPQLVKAIAAQDPTAIPSLLLAARNALSELSSTRSVLIDIGEALQHRADPGARRLRTPADAVAAVRDLVTSDNAGASGAAARALGDARMAARQPGDALAAALHHFCGLFEVTSGLEGAVPAMTKLYMTLSEQRNMLRDLASSLGLPPDSGPTALMAATVAAISRPAQPPPPGTSSSAGASAGAASSPIQQQQDHQDGSGALLALVVRTLGAKSSSDAPAVAERLVGRLRRLDDVLPRYQGVAAQLYELLRVPGLDAVLPAVQALVGAVQQQQQQHA